MSTERVRVVVTGIGVACPLGIGREELWRSVVAGRSGAGPITLFDTSDFAVTMACEVPDFVPGEFMDKKVARRMDRYAQLGVAAARLAIADAGFDIGDGADVGAILGNGAAGPLSREDQHRVMLERGPDRISPFAIPMQVANMGAGQVSMELGLHGPVAAMLTACAAGTDAIGTATEVIRRGDARAMLAGGAECTISPYFVAGFDSMKVLSHRLEDPAGAARPYDASRDGFLIGEAGAILMLERLDDALARGAEILCEIAGYGASADAHHLTAPNPTGAIQARAVKAALADAGLEPEQVEHINAHGGSSPTGDPIEIAMFRSVFGDDHAAKIAVSATKSMHGHCMGAAGALEGAITVLAIHGSVLPPTLNLNTIDPACVGVDHVAHRSRPAKIHTALSTNYGLGGHNAALALTRFE